ncbi:MAG: tetratricopeptide repeat protein, partial [Desulfosalsimonas sp.]
VLSEILEHRPGQPELSFLAGAAFYTMEDYESALRYFKALEPEDDHYGEAAVYQAIILRKQDKLGQAVGFLESAMEKADESQRLELIPYLSAFYQEEGGFRKAEGLLTEGLSREPENAELHYEMGVLYDKMGDTEAAIDKMLFVIEMDPENADALNYLGYTYADQDIRLQEAEALIRQALELDPDNGYFLDSMGWVYYRKGDYEKARQYIERAVDRVSDDPVILEHMGDVYSRLGDMQKALRYYRRARENADEDARQGLAEKIESVDNPGGEH